MRLALLVTSRCNASCIHCTTDSSPHKSLALGGQRIKDLMTEAAALRARGDPLLFCISGGEPFLDFKQLLETVSHGTALGGQVTCTTNGSWASSDDRARSMLGALKEAGLYALGVSTSQFHQEYVKPDRVRRALAIARGHGIKTILKCAVTKSDRKSGWARSFARSVRPDKVEIFPVVPYLRSGAALPEDEYIRKPGLPRGRCPAAMLTIREDGRAYTCCNPGGFVDALSLGNALDSGLEPAAEKFHTQALQQVLIRRGPAYLAKAISAQGLGERLRSSYADVCDLCAHIAGDKTLADIAVKVSEQFERERMKALFKAIPELGRPARLDEPAVRDS